MLIAWIAFALVAVGVLAYVMTFGVRRRWRLREFAERHGGEYTMEETARYQRRWSASSLSDGGIVGAIVRFDDGERRIALFDVHPDPAHPPRGTCCWVSTRRSSEARRGDDEIGPNREGGGELSSFARGETPNSLERTLERPEAPADLDVSARSPTSHDPDEAGWWLESDVRASDAMICSRGRALHDAEEWKALIAYALGVAAHDSSDSSEVPETNRR